MKKRGQVWVETVTYTLIAFVLIGLILAFVKPKIEQVQDHSVIDQSISMMKQINSVIQDVVDSGAGNKRMVEITLKKGSLNFNTINNTIYFEIDSKYMYSEPNQTYNDGGVLVTTNSVGDNYLIDLTEEYHDYNLTYGGEKVTKKILKAGVPYELYITNNGGENTTIDFQID